MYNKVIIFLFFNSFLYAGVKGQSLQWISSSEISKWKKESPVLPVISNSISKDSITIIDPKAKGRTIDGFGGCFNEKGGYALGFLAEKDRKEVINSLFDKNGCRFSLCRMPIGASDYAMDWYSHNETPGDFEMKKISIERDHKYLLPYIKSAKVTNPGLKIWASPWSPPSWLKYNQHYACIQNRNLKWSQEIVPLYTPSSALIQDSVFLKAHAKYLALFSEAYLKQDVGLYAIHVQNEVAACQIFPSCVWTGETLRDFIKKYLGPEFKARKLPIELWLGTINDGNFRKYAGTVLEDIDASKFITGVGYQWDGKDAIAECLKTYPEKTLMQTENECGDGKNSWSYAEYVFGLIKHYFDNGANSYMYWNMVLPNDSGSSAWGWKQNCMISIDSASKKAVYNPEFYVMKHFSYFIDPGSAKLNLEGNHKNMVAFKNTSGEIIVEIINPDNKTMDKFVRVSDKIYHLILSPHSINTFVSLKQ